MFYNWGSKSKNKNFDKLEKSHIIIKLRIYITYILKKGEKYNKN